MTGWACPDLLRPPANNQIAQHPTPWDTLLPPPERRKIFTGLHPPTAEDSSAEPPTVDLESDTVSDDGTLQVALDIDSAGGLASSLAVAREGIYWKARRANISNLQSGLHLDSIRVQWLDARGQLRHRRQPLHRVPHLPFGRLGGFYEVELYILFPRLYHPLQDHFVITKEEWETWTDEIFLPAIQAVSPSSIGQHFPSSAAHIERSANAPQRETRTQAGAGAVYTQDFHYRLQPDRLAALWHEIQRRVLEEGHSHFRDSQIVLTAKNLKLITQRPTWSQARDLFLAQWSRAVNPTFLQRDFYDIAKEMISHRHSPPFPHAPPDPPLTLSWRRCCLDGFCRWLSQSEAAATLPASAATLSEADRTAGQPHGDSDPGVSAGLLETQPRPHVETHSVGSSDSESDHHLNEPQSADDGLPRGPQPPAGWRVQFYPQSFLRDQGSMTIAPSPSSPIWKRGLRYVQMYNTSKEVFAAGNHYLFANEGLDTLALDPGMARSWQHVGGAVSHSPLVVLRAYLHTKQRCDVALRGCRYRSYGTREEYRVTGAVFHAMDAILRTRNLAATPIVLPPSCRPFFVHPTPLVLDWWRWNINKLCLGFEMTYSLRPRTFVHWEHTRVMMMFLRCLTSAYGGQGAHLRRSLGLWIDRRTRRPREGSDREQVQEGMALGMHLERSGYAWMADKLDWAMMIFLPAHRAHMVFNTPSLQSAYHARYWQVVRARDDFLLFHDIFSRLQEHRLEKQRSALLLQLLVDLCLRAFRKDVFQTLADRRRVQQPLSPERIREACAGEVPLTGAGVRYVFEHGRLSDDLHFVSQAHIKLPHVEGLFIWLWGWDGDGNRGDMLRKHWNDKAYRVLYRQCFGVIAQTHGVQQARAWRLRLKETWIRTHWVLPYPSDETFWSAGTKQYHGKLRAWASVHPEVVRYYRQSQPTGLITVPPDDVDSLPVSGWKCAWEPSPLTVTVSPVPADLAQWLAVVNDSSPVAAGEIPLPARGVRSGAISQYVRQMAPERRHLRSFQRVHQVSDSELHKNDAWLQQHLLNHLRAVVETQRDELSSLQRPLVPSTWQRRPRPRLEAGLAPLNLCVQQLEDQDSDPENLRSGRDRLSRRLHRKESEWRTAQKEIRRQLQCEQENQTIRQALKSHLLTDEERQHTHARFFQVRARYRIACDRLAHASRESAKPWR